MTQATRLQQKLAAARQRRTLLEPVPGSDGTVRVRYVPLDIDAVERFEDHSGLGAKANLARACGVLADTADRIEIRGDDGWERISDGFTVELARELGMLDDGVEADDIQAVDIVRKFYLDPDVIVAVYDRVRRNSKGILDPSR